VGLGVARGATPSIFNFFFRINFKIKLIKT
jgi:hypothetical protein